MSNTELQTAQDNSFPAFLPGYEEKPTSDNICKESLCETVRDQWARAGFQPLPA